MTLKKSSYLLLAIALLAVSCSGSKEAKNETEQREKTYIERYDDALAAFEKKQYYNCIEDFTFVIFNAPGSDIADDAQFYLAESQYGLGEYLVAINEFQQLLSRWPQSDLTEKTRYRLAECYFALTPHYTRDQSYGEKAIAAFQNFIDEYPFSTYRQEAENNIREIRLGMARKIQSSAQVYMVLKEWNAALITLQEIQDSYFDTEILSEALLDMAECHVNLQEYDKAMEYLAKISAENFEESNSLRYNRLLKEASTGLK